VFALDERSIYVSRIEEDLSFCGLVPDGAERSMADTTDIPDGAELLSSLARSLALRLFRDESELPRSTNIPCRNCLFDDKVSILAVLSMNDDAHDPTSLKSGCRCFLNAQPKAYSAVRKLT